jgi:hypothetical protein
MHDSVGALRFGSSFDEARKLMRTNPISKVLLRHIAIPTKHLQVRWKSLLYDPSPPVARMDRFSITLAVIIDMIKRQERSLRLTTTHTFSAVV